MVTCRNNEKDVGATAREATHAIRKTNTIAPAPIAGTIRDACSIRDEDLTPRGLRAVVGSESECESCRGFIGAYNGPKDIRLRAWPTICCETCARSATLPRSSMPDSPDISALAREFIELPVIKVILRALALPLCYLPELWQVSLITLGLFVATNAIGIAFDRLGSPGVYYYARGAGILLHAITVTPFAVAWSRFAIDGVGAISDRRVLTFKEVEGRYAVASIALWLILLLPALSFVNLATTARQSGNEEMVALLALLLLAAMAISVLMLVWTSFLFTAIATERYLGILVAWKQTRGYLDTLGAIEAGICVPFLLLRGIAYYFIQPTAWNLEWFLRFLAGNAVFLYWEAAFVCGPAVAYRLVVLRKGVFERSAAASAAKIA
jgi:hypothetical protein